MFIHVPSAWLAHVRLYADRRVGARHADLAASACRRRRQDRGPDRRHLHLHRPGHRLALGQADVGHLLGVGRAADLGARALPALSRADRAVAIDRRAGHAPAAPPPSSRWSAPSMCRSSITRSMWWNTLHQPASVFRSAARPSIPRCSAPLLVMAIAFTLLFVLLHLIAMRAEILRRRVRALQQTPSRARRPGRGLSSAMPDLGPHADPSSSPLMA